VLVYDLCVTRVHARCASQSARGRVPVGVAREQSQRNSLCYIIHYGPINGSTLRAGARFTQAERQVRVHGQRGAVRVVNSPASVFLQCMRMRGSCEINARESQENAHCKRKKMRDQKHYINKRL
jgi:hypothetical protein